MLVYVSNMPGTATRREKNTSPDKDLHLDPQIHNINKERPVEVRSEK